MPKTPELIVDFENSLNDSSEAHYTFPEPDATVIPSHHFNALHQAGKNLSICEKGVGFPSALA